MLGLTGDFSGSMDDQLPLSDDTPESERIELLRVLTRVGDRHWDRRAGERPLDADLLGDLLLDSKLLFMAVSSEALRILTAPGLLQL